MSDSNPFLAKRIALQDEFISLIALAAQRFGATAFHLFGSLGRGDADALSDIDVWLTFPDNMIASAVLNRFDLFAQAGDILIFHEMAPNRPPSGAYALVLHETTAGPFQIDWHLAPQSSSRVFPTARVVFADPAVPTGELPTDAAAEHTEHRSERIDWLICMLFIAIKMRVRGDSTNFMVFLSDSYRAIGNAYKLQDLSVTEPVSLTAISSMLHQLDRRADGKQRRALHAVDDFQRMLGDGRQ